MKLEKGESLVVVLGNGKFGFEYTEGDIVTDSDVDNLRTVVANLLATEGAIRARNPLRIQQAKFDPFDSNGTFDDGYGGGL